MDSNASNCFEHELAPPLAYYEGSLNMNCVEHEPSPPCEISSNIYIPQVRDEHKPKIGQEFASLDDVYSFYNNYAKEGGFGIRSNSTRRSRCKDKESDILMKEYVCYKEGENVIKKDSEVKRRRGNTREGCKARLQVVKAQTGPCFIVRFFDEGHNHALATPRKVGFLRSHRHVSDVKKCLTQQLSEANIPTHQQMSILEIQAGGLGNIGCTEKDIRNEKLKVRKLLDGHDADMLYEHFMGEQETNPSFCFAIETDSDGKITHVFWADASMRMNYSYFGDVIVFDTTYNTNRYGMVFAPILGVNSHWKTVTFSCAFLCDESTASFEWLFSQFLRFMPGPPPGMIITDQDLAMEKAIASKLQSTHHRYCIWHITNKFSEKLGPATYDKYYQAFKSCIWDSESGEEFDAKWFELLEKANLQDHKWLKSMYEVRAKWIPGYVRHIFSAGMSSSQRAESHHAFFKRFGDKHNSLMDFITRFTRGLGRQRHEELNDDHMNINEHPMLKTPLPMEKQMADTYSRFIFYKFQEELWQSMLYVVTVKSDDESTSTYKAIRVDRTNDRERELVEKKDLGEVYCTCKKFEFEGIPCRHMLSYFRKKDILYLPTKYILHRWTKASKKGKVIDGGGVEVSDACDKSLLASRTMLGQISNNVIEDVLSSSELIEMFKENLLQFHAKIKPMLNKSGVGDSTKSNQPRQSIYSEPSQVSFKGCGKRLKRGKEKSKSKGRHCNYCGEHGATHDKRNCPKKIIGASPLGPQFENSPNDEDNCSTGLDDEESS